MNYTKNASDFHKQVGDILLSLDGPFSGYTIRQEIPVKTLYPNYPFASHRFDWFIKELGLVIECHGEQHYQIQFDINRDELSIDKLYRQKYRDIRKAEAAISAGLTYIEIPYWIRDKLNSKWIIDQFNKNKNPKKEINDLSKESIYRRNRYRQIKQWIKFKK